MNDIKTYIIVSLMFGVIFSLRKMAQMYSVYMRSLMLSYLTEPWNYLDIASSIGFTMTMVMILAYGAGDVYKLCAVVSSIFMWLKFLGVIKALNQKV